ncbi:hypothetical protein Trydic_g16162 [Trypoxylus dichotomus]
MIYNARPIRVNLREVVSPHKGPGTGRRHLPRCQARSQEVRHAYDQHMLRLRHFPSQWKLADVAMIRKPGQSHNWPQNYRPISLLPVMSKIADRIILARLREETDDLDVIPGCQFGFRREHSTTHQVLRLVEHIKEGFNRRECTGAVFLDVAKAFDKVWHQGLLLKMHRAGISKAMVKLVQACRKGQRSHPCCSTSTPATSRQPRTSTWRCTRTMSASTPGLSTLE